MSNSRPTTADLITPAVRRALAIAGRVGGSVSTPRKAAAAAANARHSAATRARSGPLPKPLHDISCTCAAANTLIRADGLPAHPTTCPRGRAIRRRLAAGKLLV